MTGMLSVEANRVRKSFLKEASFPPGRVTPHQPTRELVAVWDASFRIMQGERFVILGAAGSGKSTLLRMIATLLLPDEGSIHVFGHDAVRAPMSVQRLVGYVPTDTLYLKKLSALDNLFYSAGLRGFNARATQSRVEKAFQSLGLDVYRHSDPMSDLPLAIQRIVAIVRALLRLPRVLVLDEPTRRLDSKSTRALLDSLVAVNENAGTTLLLATSDADAVRDFYERRVILKDGSILAHSKANEQATLAAATAETTSGRSNLVGAVKDDAH